MKTTFRIIGLLITVIATITLALSATAGPPPLNFIRADKPVVIDGKLNDWALNAPVSYEVDPNAFDQKIKTYAMWDDQNIYLAYVVRDASPMKNSGDDPSAAFKSGDSLHFYFSTDTEVKGKSANGGVNDYHILMTIQKGKPVIFAFRQAKTGVDKTTKISSPATSIDIAWMGPVTGAEMVVANSGGLYTAEVKLPIAFFDGFRPDAGRKVATDVAVNFSDNAGSKNLAKVWWSRGASQILDIPTELRFERNLWGTGVFCGAGENPIVIDSSDLFVVPSPGKVAIDGDLSDWNLSCAYGPMYVDPSLKDKYNVTWTLMYDKDALYLAAVFNAAQPFTNDGGVNNVWWYGDSIEIRMAADPKNQGGDIKKNMDILTFALWHNAGEKKDYIALQRSFSFLTGDSSSATIQSKVTPGGRTFEARVPWTIIQSGNFPKAGDSIQITMAGIWKNGLRAYGMGSISSFRGMGDWGQAHFLAEAPKTVYVNLQQPAVANNAIAIKAKTTVELPEKGLLSAGVYRADGTLLRTLVAGQSTNGAKAEIGWDGYDDDGKAVAAGKYEVRALLNAGLHAKYVTSATSPGKPPYESENPNGGWGGVWDNVQDIASDATGIYPLWGVEEGDGLLIHADEDGNVLWRQHSPLAQPGRQISVASNGKYVYILSDKNGLWRVFCKDGKYAPIAHNGSDPLGFKLSGIANGASLAADAKTVYISVPTENKIACFDAETLVKTGEINVIKPAGICLDGDNGLLAVSDINIVGIDIKSGLSTVIVSKKLVAPFDVAVDKKGKILVTDRGIAQQIKRFDRKGKLTGTFGKPGGRENNGKFYVDQLRRPAGITVAASGKIFYSEDAAPKIFVRLNANLKYEKLWCGPWYISGEVCVDPEKPQDLYIWGGEAIIRHKIDYKTKTSRPDAAWEKFAMTNYGRWFPRIVNHNGNKYMFCGGTPCSIFKIDGYKMTLVASIGADWKNKETPMWIFNDLNENGKADPGEKVDFKATTDPLTTYRGSYWAGSISEKDLSVYLNNNSSIIILTPTFSKTGMPIYSFSSNTRAFPLAAAQKPGKNAGFSNIWHSPDGGVFGNADANGSDPRGIGHSSHLSDVYVYRLDKDGKLLWRAGKKASGIAKNGEFYGRACGLGGPIDGKYFDFVDENGQEKIYTFDGLFAGNLLDDSATALPSENTLRVEHFNSIVYQNAEDKKWYFVAGAGGYASIWEIAGLDKITRMTAEIEIK